MGAAPTIAQAKLALQQAGCEVDLAIRHDADELVKSYIKPTLFGLVKSALVSTAIGGAGALIGSLIFGKRKNSNPPGGSPLGGWFRSAETKRPSQVGFSLGGGLGGIASSAAIFAARYAVRAVSKAVSQRFGRKSGEA